MENVIAELVMKHIPEAKTINFPDLNHVEFTYKDNKHSIYFDEDTKFSDIERACRKIKEA